MGFPTLHIHITVRRTIHHHHIQENTKQVDRSPLLGSSWAERIYSTWTCKKSFTEMGDTLVSWMWWGYKSKDCC